MHVQLLCVFRRQDIVLACYTKDIVVILDIDSHGRFGKFIVMSPK